MRIGLLTTSFPRSPHDVAGCFVRGFAEALAARGHELDVLAPEPPSGSPPLTSHPGVTLTWVPYLRPRSLQRTFYGAGVPDNLGRDPAAWLGLGPFVFALALATARRQHRWDAVISHWALPSALVAEAFAPDRPHLAVLHSADVHLLTKLPARRMLAERIARATLLFSAPVLKERFASCLGPSSRLLLEAGSYVSPMGIEPPPRTADRASLRAKFGMTRFTLVAMSRLVPIKGLEVAIRAVAARPDVELFVAGDGPSRSALECLARSLDANVRFLGTVTGRRKWELLFAADAFVSSSRPMASGRTEGAPTSIIEALAAGLPVLATDTGGVGSLVTHERTGLLVPTSSPGALGSAIDRLVRDPALTQRLAEAARDEGRKLTWPELAPFFDHALRNAR